MSFAWCRSMPSGTVSELRAWIRDPDCVGVQLRIGVYTGVTDSFMSIAVSKAEFNRFLRRSCFARSVVPFREVTTERVFPLFASDSRYRLVVTPA